MSLKQQAAKSVVWVAVERFGQQLIQVVFFIILARLLTPEDFGLVAMIMIFFAISQSFVDSGMGQALVRLKEITDADRSTVFWFNLGISLLFCIGLYFAAPSIATFFDESRLTNLVRFMGMAILFNGIAIVQRSELTQLMDFKTQALVQIPTTVVGGVISVAMAFMGFGVWALATQFVITALVSSAMLWMIKPSKILFNWNPESFKQLFGFGYKLLMSGLLDTTYQHIYKLVIGKFFAASTLGYYTQANNIQQMAGQNLVGIIQKVTYPLLSKTVENPARMKTGYRQVIQTSSFVIFPGMFLLIVFAKPMITIILGEKWEPAVSFLQIICLGEMMYHLHAINLNVLKVLGRSDLFLKLEVMKKFCVTLAIIIGIQFGIFGLLVGQVINSYIALIINTHYTAKFIQYPISEQLFDVLKVIALSIPMVVVSLIIINLTTITSVVGLVIALMLAVMTYLISNLIYRSETVVALLDILKHHLPLKLSHKLGL